MNETRLASVATIGGAVSTVRSTSQEYGATQSSQRQPKAAAPRRLLGGCCQGYRGMSLGARSFAKWRGDGGEWRGDRQRLTLLGRIIGEEPRGVAP